ncbi:Probable Co/Zn/Cd efflux system membrane fusion protein [Olavius algarvensis associated proteobacterium Delta 3]|nr:Probable Co/Zn/Cd efflux system membrane fusion protein [Olavius algarvensis associated proteobacterium Delta 3]
MTPTRQRLVQFLFTAAMIAGGAAAFLIITANKPELKRTQPAPPVPMVRVMTVEATDLAIPIGGEGTVQPLREIDLVPQVSGKIVEISPALVDGGRFSKGDLLLRIESEDYELAVTLADARVKDAESNLVFTEEEAAAAVEEWRLLERKDDPPPLVAKIPQLAAARARLAAEKADLKKARLNLARTEVRAPFNGRVSSESVGLGQYVSTGQTLATIFSTNAAEIVVPLEDSALFWFHVPGFTPGDGPGAPVRITARIAGRDLTWAGRVVRAEGKMDPRTRLINVVVRVDNPYQRKPPLAAGLFVTVDIEGQRLTDAVAIPSAALRENRTVWVVGDDGVLSFRSVDVARVMPNQAIIKGGLLSGERVVTSPLRSVTDGMKVRVSAGGRPS